ncbi:PLC-like phosphodiesterase [Aspergillus heterothallicus]
MCHLGLTETGDGITDDTAAVQQVFNDYGDGSKIIFVDSGTYMLTDTVTIPKDAKIHGEAWSYNPRVMLKIGEEGDEGTVEMQDLILTTKGGTAGVALMQWNVKAANPGDAALWDVHARIGGATGTELTPDECPALTDGTNPASDPDLDDAYNNMTQYNFHGAQNIFTTMIQTEAPYYQPTPKPPAPFGNQVGVYDSDPDYSCSGGDFDGCDEAWAVIITGCQNIHIGGAGTYSWFSTYTQDCIDKHSCQKVLWYLDSNYNNVRLQHVIAIGAEYILVADGNGVLSTDNLAIESHPAWAQISIFDVPSQGQAPNPGDGDDSDGGCNIDDNTWTDVDTREGEYFDTSVLDIDLIGVPNGRQYITIVNLTPYKFVYQNDTSHTYQMDEWDFGDIPPGRSRQCVMDYYDGKQDYDPVDDKGEAYYVVEGTDRQFNIKARTHYAGDESATWTKRTIVDLSDWGLGEREFKDPQVGVPVSFVITGSEDYGYYTSLSFDTSGLDAWMSNLQATIGDRQIKHVIMPGSHDSGMDRISTSWLGSSPNTQTQGLSIYGQLKVGVRYFDLRVVRLNDGTFVAAHVNDERAGTIAGGAGEPLDDILDDINTKLEIIDNRCPNLLEEINSNTLDELTFGTYLDSSDGAGCVIFINGGTTDADIQEVTTEDLDRGIYGTGRLPRTDNWSEKSDPKEVADDQVSYYPNLRATIGGEDDTFYIWQWVATLSALPEYGI